MSEQKGITNNATFAALMPALAVPVLGAIVAYENVTVAGVAAWVRSDVRISRWAFWLWITWTVFATAFFVMRKFFAPKPQARSVLITSEKRAAPYAAYTSDEFYGLRWRWTVSSNGGFFAMKMFCPKCDFEVTAEEFEANFAGEQGHMCQCDHCKYITILEGVSISNLMDRAAKSAEMKIRNGEWKKAVKT